MIAIRRSKNCEITKATQVFDEYLPFCVYPLAILQNANGLQQVGK
jgi:hypothetical protein